MTVPDEYVAILRCQTWNVWPDRRVAEDRSFMVDYGAGTPLLSRLAVLSYETRSAPERFTAEATSIGPLVWDGETPGLHRVRDSVLKAPEDAVEVVWKHRNANPGELDICIVFRFAGDIPPALHEALRASANAVVSLINLRLRDFLTPTAPFQIRKVLPSGNGQLESTLLLSVHNRRTLTDTDLQETVTHIANAMKRSVLGPKFVTALELYAAHFTESQARVRFILLVVAIESLSNRTRKHAAAVDLLRRWEADLANEKRHYPESSDAWQSLDALRRELGFRTDDSIRSQVRKLFAGLSGVSSEKSAELQRNALRVYDKRSTLVHDGHLPAAELIELERDARELLEKVFRSAFDSQPGGRNGGGERDA